MNVAVYALMKEITVYMFYVAFFFKIRVYVVSFINLNLFDVLSQIFVKKFLIDIIDLIFYLLDHLLLV